MLVFVLQILTRKYRTSYNFRVALPSGKENSALSRADARNAFGFLCVVVSLHFD